MVVNDFLTETEHKIVENMIREEQQMMEEQVRKYINNLTDECCQMALQEEVCQVERRQVGVQKTVKKMAINPEIFGDQHQCISKMIDDKINHLLPRIIE